MNDVTAIVHFTVSPPDSLFFSGSTPLTSRGRRWYYSCNLTSPLLHGRSTILTRVLFVASDSLTAGVSNSITGGAKI